MTLTATLVYHSPNHLRYILVYDGNQGGLTATLTTTGQPASDILTDAPQGPIHKLASAVTDGFAQFAAGPQTQAKSRALWLSDRLGPASANPAFPGGGVSSDNSNPLITTAICKATADVNPPVIINVDAGVDGGGNPVITATIVGIPGGAATVGYLDIEVPQAIGI